MSVSSTQVSVCFPLCSLNIRGCNPPFFPNLLSPTSILPRPTPPTPRTCGPGGAGACSPEDRGSTGSQKHLSVPFPLCPKAPGTALNSASECVFKERRLDNTPKCLNEADVQRVLCRARMSVFQPAPKHTVVSVTANSWPSRHPQSCQHRKVLPLPRPDPTQPTTKTLTWLLVSFSPTASSSSAAPSQLLPLYCACIGNTHVACP